ncbi:helix-turn-helix domain-containing protein [Rhodopila globiformis]|uniref:XRE family transcriptional regulator n=1 Tax=Rhodopila globiformis TaxID=1071 RepID=A0A2S6N283_RHOGL|nr:helix-turn-helix domain-containing protein [Rhodopila globiformis]PPQ28719.1 XRE family transcriptional regulator [Rhodopila globiformis]
MTTQGQFRAARSLLHLDQAELARRAEVSLATIRRIETPDGEPRVAPATVDTVRRVLEEAGAEFIPHGVRRRTEGSAQEVLLRDLQAISQRSAARLKGQAVMTEADLYNEDGLPA